MDKKVLRLDTNCRICNSNQITTILKLKDTPMEDQFVSEVNKDVLQPVYPLELAICNNCGYTFLPYIVSPEVSYTDYIYESSVTVGLRNHFNQYAKEIVEEYKVNQGSLVVDLGSNDGSMLASFKILGMKVVGVEPARVIAEKATESGVYTINDFFTDKVVSQIRTNYGSASVVTANYMFANIDDILSFTRAVTTLLEPNGIFVVQTGYHPEEFKIKMFDYIYHEHFSYFTTEVLQFIFSLCGLELIQATKTSPKGGSLRVVGQLKGGARVIGSSVNQIINEEKQSGVRNPETYKKLSSDLDAEKKKLVEKLNELKAAGKKIAGLGASHSTTTFTYHFGLGPFLDYQVDDNVLKHGRYSPGLHIPVLSTDILYKKDAPEYVVILAWQHQKSIIERHNKYLKSGGKFIIPLPEFSIISNDDAK